MLFIVMFDFRTVSGDGGWQCVEACGCQLYVLAPRYGVCRSSERGHGQIGSGLISRLILIQAKLSVFGVKKR